MEKILKLIAEISKIRKVPQFLLADTIKPQSVIKIRTEIFKFKSKNKDSNVIDFIINSPGGSADDAYRIIRSLRENFQTVNIIVPFWAKSAGTLLSLGASTIIMDEFGELGPLDVQILKEMDDRPDYESESALIDENSLNRIETRSLELYHKMFINLYTSDHIHINKNELSNQILDYLAKLYEPLLKQINPYKLGDKKRKLDIGIHYAKRILALYNPELPKDKRESLIDYLVNGCPDHGYVIDLKLIQGFLPNVCKSDKFGADYKDKLNKLSHYFMSESSILYVGFVLDNEKNEEEKEAVKQELK